MAVEQVGTPIVLNISSGTYLDDISVPAAANFAVFFFAGYASTPDTCFNSGQYSVSIDSQSFTHVIRSTANSIYNYDVVCAVLANPSTGTQELSITIDNITTNGNLFAIVFYSGVDTDDPILDSDASDNNGSITISNLQTATGSMSVFGACAASTGNFSTGSQTQVLKYGPDTKSSLSWILVGEAAEYASVTLAGSTTSAGMVAISLNPRILPVTYAVYTQSNYFNDGGDVTSTDIGIEIGDVVLVFWTNGESATADVVSISNTGPSLTWVNRASVKPNARSAVYAWYAIAATAGTIAVTVESTGTSTSTGVLHCIVHTGAHATDPVPTGKVYSGYNTTDVSQSITPSKSLYSCLWMVCTDYDQTVSFVERSGNVIVSYESSNIDTILLRPAVQPLLDGNAVVLGETDTSGIVSWVALEVQAADIPVLIAWLTA